MKRNVFIIMIIVMGLLLLSCNDSTEPEMQVATPVISPDGGSYSEPMEVTITTQTEGATIRYTLDNSEPTESSALFNNAIFVDSSATIKARAYKDGWKESEIAMAWYAIIEMQPIEWCLIPAGDFTYGQDNQILSIDYEYEIMKYEVTNAQYLEYLEEAYANGDIWVSGDEVQGHYSGDEDHGEGIYRLYSLGTDLLERNVGRISYDEGHFMLNYPSDFSISDYLNHPVVYVSWFGAWHFAEHYGWRIPTEQEWEKSARGMTGYDYPWGNAIDGSRANYNDSGDPYDNGTTPVGFYNGETHLVNGISFTTVDSPSPFDVYDLAGIMPPSGASDTHGFRCVRDVEDR